MFHDIIRIGILPTFVKILKKETIVTLTPQMPVCT